MILGTVAFMFVYHTSVTNRRSGEDHVTDANHSVIRHNHQSSSGIAGYDRQGRSFICQQCTGGGGLWNVEQDRTQGRITTL